MYEIKTEKKLLRKKYSDIRKTISDTPDIKKEYDRKICRTITSLATFRFADTVLIYSPTSDEIDVNEITLSALSTGKKVAFPRCNPETCTMNFHFISSLEDLKCGSYGIMEPDESLPIYKPDNCERAVCVIPGLVYDEYGYRLGYGKGYYDRFFAARRNRDTDPQKNMMSLIGVIYGSCIAKKLPHGKFDLSVDILVTEKGVKTLYAD